MLRFQVYDKALTWLGTVTGSVGSDEVMPARLHEARVVLRHNKPGEASFTVDADHHLADDLGTPGARVVAEYRPAPGEPWRRELSGPVTAVAGAGYPATRTFTIGDDKDLLWGLLAWPTPDQLITAQTATHWRREGPAETVVKALIAANAGRWAHPVTVAPDLARGASKPLLARFQPLADLALPLLEDSGLGISVIQADDDTSLLVEVYAKRVHTVALSDRSGVIVPDTAGFTTTRPTVTRPIVGSGKEGLTRRFNTYPDTTTEAEWGMVREAFKDAADIDPDPVVEVWRDSLMEVRAAEMRADAAGTASLSLELVETEHFRYPTAVQLGDVIKASVAGSSVLSDTVTEVTITQDTGGVRVIPKVGGLASTPDNPNATLARAVAHIARAIRSTQTGR